MLGIYDIYNANRGPGSCRCAVCLGWLRRSSEDALCRPCAELLTDLRSGEAAALDGILARRIGGITRELRESGNAIRPRQQTGRGSRESREAFRRDVLRDFDLESG